VSKVLLDPQVLEEQVPQVSKVQLVHRVPQDSTEQLVPQVSKGLRARRDQPVLVLLALKEAQVLQAQLDPQEPQVQEQLALLVWDFLV
jgi:hypothetical protein